MLQARIGNADAFGELVRRHQGPVFGVCYRLTGERLEAEDAAQEAFIRAYQRLHTFDAGRPFGPWMRRVAANVCLNRLQARPPAQVPLDEERDWQPPNQGGDPQLAYERREDRERLREAMLALPPRYRVVLELRHFQDLSYDEIASALGLPLSDVKSHLFRARKQLAARMNADE
ncbi:MAG TPA: sigma-70 family RNA polymerase sigma factor [Herpetosiphonaceae bacterium]